jgi:hypothetical protein
MSRTTRKPYTKSKAVDSSCRSHGSCPWCGNARKYKQARQAPAGELDLPLLVRWWVRQNFLTMNDAAADLGVSASFLSQVQTGRKPVTNDIMSRMGLEVKTVKTVQVKK